MGTRLEVFYAYFVCTRSAGVKVTRPKNKEYSIPVHQSRCVDIFMTINTHIMQTTCIMVKCPSFITKILSSCFSHA